MGDIMNYRIKKQGLNAPVQKWAKDRHVARGTLFPAPCPVADKMGGKKGKPVPYDDDALMELLHLNGGNWSVFHFMTRISGWLFNGVSNKHLVSKVRRLFPWMNNYVPFPLPRGKKAFAEKIYCEGNLINVDQVKGQWVHVKAGVAHLSQVRIGTDIYVDDAIFWYVPAGWIAKELVEKI